MPENDREIFVDNLPLAEARERWRTRLDEAGCLGAAVETIAVDDALGRVTAAPLFARRSSPFYNAAAMDGIAVRCTDTIGAGERRPVRLPPDRYRVVNTGNALPDGFDAVVMIEDVHTLDDGSVELIRPVAPWQHVRAIGEDIVATELVLPQGHVIRPVDQGALLAAGLLEVPVSRRPTVAVIPTGSELVPPGAPAEPGNIIEFNSRVLAGYVSEWGGEARRRDIVADDPGALATAIAGAAAECDMVLVNAGASVGSRDHTAAVLADLGEIVVRGVNIKPGKPVILALVGKTPVIGLPGYPVSAVLTARLFVRPLLCAMQGVEPPPERTAAAILSRPLSSKIGVEEFVRVKLGLVGDTPIATPVSRGAGAVMSLVRADGILVVPAGSEGIGAGEEVVVELLRDISDIENTLVFIGSHDNILDVLANLLRKERPACYLSSAHVGSLGGIMAIRRGEAHVAGTHLLDEDSGEYNVPFIKRYLAGVPLALVNLAWRDQGLMVRRGNPRGIAGMADLARPDVTFINRQRGAGTRILADLKLRELGIAPEQVNGYGREEYTHMTVACAVASGDADAGLGIRAAARALGLDFVPVARERYDLIIPESAAEDDKITRLLSVIRENAEFRKLVERLGGYDLGDSGTVVYRQ